MYVDWEIVQVCLWAGYYEHYYGRLRSDHYSTDYADNRAGFSANI